MPQDAGRADSLEAALETEKSRLLDRLHARSMELFARMMVAHYARGEILELDEIVGLPAQIIRHHGRRRTDRRHHRYANPLTLNRLDEPPEITVAREQDGMIDVLSHLEHVDCQLDIHVALYSAPPHRVGELLCRLCNHRVAIVVEPIDERSDWRVLLILDQGGIVERSDQPSLGAEQFEQPLVVDVECQATCGGIEVGSVDEYGDSLLWIENHVLQMLRQIRFRYCNANVLQCASWVKEARG